MTSVILSIKNKYYYGCIKVDNHSVNLINKTEIIKEANPPKNVILNGIFLHYFLNELRSCKNYRNQFINYAGKCNFNKLNIILTTPRHEIIDYKWNLRLSHMIYELCELDHELSWLSTLGGAFSALGDYFLTHADIAGRISCHQMKLAQRLGDPNVVARCYLYFSLSLIQKHKFRAAKFIILKEYNRVQSAQVVDFRLVNMCKGIWAKLQYEKSLRIQSRKLIKVKL